MQLGSMLAGQGQCLGSMFSPLSRSNSLSSSSGSTGGWMAALAYQASSDNGEKWPEVQIPPVVNIPPSLFPVLRNSFMKASS